MSETEERYTYDEIGGVIRVLVEHQRQMCQKADTLTELNRHAEASRYWGMIGGIAIAIEEITLLMGRHGYEEKVI